MTTIYIVNVMEGEYSDLWLSATYAFSRKEDAERFATLIGADNCGVQEVELDGYANASYKTCYTARFNQKTGKVTAGSKTGHQELVVPGHEYHRHDAEYQGQAHMHMFTSFVSREDALARARIFAAFHKCKTAPPPTAS